MTEELFVEKPLMAQLQAMGWQVIEHGKGIPKNPSIHFSKKTNRREKLLRFYTNRSF